MDIETTAKKFKKKTHSSIHDYTTATCHMQNVPQEYHRIKGIISPQILSY